MFDKDIEVVTITFPSAGGKKFQTQNMWKRLKLNYRDKDMSEENTWN